MQKIKNGSPEQNQVCKKIKSIKVLHSNSHAERPKISMEGKWLDIAGFHAGDRIQVEYWENAICIYPAA